MPFNGSGGYNLPAGNPVVSGTTISSTVQNNTMSDVATALSNTLCKDGQSTPSASLPMGGFKLTGLGPGSATGDSLRWQQLFSQGVEADIASATTCDIGGQNTSFLRVTGTTTITSFGTNYNGPRFLRFAGALTLTHNASTLILPGAANITTAAGDICVAVPLAAGWYVAQYQRASGAPVSPSGKQVFTAGGTWTAPAGVTQAWISGCGGGGAGGGCVANARTAGAGGAGGVSASRTLVTVVPFTGYTVTVGAGGSGVSASNGGNGGASSVGALLTLAGGSGGAAGTSDVGGSPATASSGVGSGGGGGGWVSDIGGVACRAAQGGTGGNSIYSGVTTGPTFIGGAVNGSSGTAANLYGGGGSGAASTNSAGAATAGGNGAAGIVIIEW